MLDNLEAEPSAVIETETPAADSLGAPDANHEADQEIEGEGNTDATEGEGSDLSDEEVYYDLDGEEVSAADIKKWKAGHLMQSDYTKKTQAHAEEVKRFKTEREQLDNRLETLTSLESELQELVLGDLSGVNMDELREDNPSEYLRVKELKEQRGQALRKAQTKLIQVQEEIAAQGFNQLKNTLGWDDQAKYEADKKAILGYAQDAGITQQEFAKVTSPAVMSAILEAAKYRKLMADKPSVTKRVKMAPKVSKPSASNAAKPKTLAERMYGNKSQ